MASSNNLVLDGVSGSLGRQLVIKQYGNKTIVTRFPDMSKVKWTRQQKARRNVFAEAVAYAQSINNDPAKKAAYKKKLKKGQTVYHAAISEYMNR